MQNKTSKSHLNMAGVEQGNVSNEEFMDEVARYECVYHRNSGDFKDKNKQSNTWEKIGEKFNFSAAEAEVKLRNIRTAYGRHLKRLKTLPSGSGRDAVPRSENFCEPKTDVFDGFEADDDVA